MLARSPSQCASPLCGNRAECFPGYKKFSMCYDGDMENKRCLDCGVQFTPNSSRHVRCSSCGAEAKRLWRREWFREFRKRNPNYFNDHARRRRREAGILPFELRGRENRKTRRQEILNLFNNKCSICAYDRCKRSLHVHHRDPARKQCDKDYMKKSFTDFDNLIVLCSNCHFEVHAGIISIPTQL